METKRKSSGTKKKHEMRKGSSTNNLFMCFGSAPDRPDPPPVITRFAGPVVLPGNDDAGLLSFGEQQQSGSVGTKVNGSSSSRRFSWKVVLFEPSARKINKLGKPGKKSLSVESARYDYQETSKKDDFNSGRRIISRSASALATSSSASSAASNSIICPTCNSTSFGTKTTSFRANPNGPEKSSARGQRGCYGSNCGLFLMLVSLLVLVLWGRVCAIFCTSTWFFFVPRWIVNGDRINSLPAMKMSSDSKRKIVMEEW